MAHGRSIRRGGVYNRLAESVWTDPLDTSYSKQRGGRWNAPGNFGVLYLNRDRRTARLQVLHKLRGQPYGIEDLDEGEQHDLLEVLVTEHLWLDCVTARGLEAVGLPTTYPRDPNGRLVPHSSCRPIGKAAYDDGRTGIACRSAVTDASTTDEELAVFDREVRTSIRATGRQTFAEWFWETV
ncbi:MAG: RES family NAD+ phosphorylase [Acidimicrobiia bacterium]